MSEIIQPLAEVLQNYALTNKLFHIENDNIKNNNKTADISTTSNEINKSDTNTNISSIDHVNQKADNATELIDQMNENNSFHLKFTTGKDLLLLIMIIVLSALIITLITAFMKDILLPPLTFLLNKIHIPDWKIILKPNTLDPFDERLTEKFQEAKNPENKEISIKIGDFLETAIITIILGSFTVLLLLNLLNSNSKKNKDN